MSEGKEGVKEPTFFVRDEDGTPLSISFSGSSGTYEMDTRTGMRKEVKTTEFRPLTVTGGRRIGERIKTELGDFIVTKPLSPEYAKNWPDAIFVRRAPLEQPKI